MLGLKSGALNDSQINKLIKTYKLLLVMNTTSRLIRDKNQLSQKVTNSGYSFLLKVTKRKTKKELTRDLNTLTKEGASLIDRLLEDKTLKKKPFKT